MKKSNFKNVQLERIPCPIDPSHTIYKHNLVLHSKICNVRTKQLEMKEEYFYCLDCNSGPNIKKSQNKTILDELLPENTQVLTQKEIDNLLLKVVKCYETLVKNNEINIKSDENVEEEEQEKDTKENQEGVVIEAEKEKEIVKDVRTEKEEKKQKINNNNDDSNNINEISNSSNSVTYLTPKSYGLLESRVLWAVSGDQVAFERIRHAKQDAKIVRCVCVHVCV